MVIIGVITPPNMGYKYSYPTCHPFVTTHDRLRVEALSVLVGFDVGCLMRGVGQQLEISGKPVCWILGIRPFLLRVGFS